MNTYTVRLETSFGNSSLAFPTDCFKGIRIFATIAVLTACIIAIIFTCGIPWDVNKESVEGEIVSVMLCRNVSTWPAWWNAIHLGGALMLLSANFMNWIGYMSRLTKLIQMKLQYTLSFQTIVMADIARKTPTIPEKSEAVNNPGDLHNIDQLMMVDPTYEDEDYDDDVDYPEPEQLHPQHGYSDSETNDWGATGTELYKSWTTPVVSDATVSTGKSVGYSNISGYSGQWSKRDSEYGGQNGGGINHSPGDVVEMHDHDTVLSQSTIMSKSSSSKPKRKPPPKISKKDIKNRMISRRKPDELRYYNLIRKQSVLTGIVSISSLLFWGIQTITNMGSLFFLIDIIINVSCVYLSVTWSKQYYNKCCSKLECCCCCCEDVKLFSFFLFFLCVNIEPL